MMFSVFCQRHGCDVLLGSADVIAVTNGPDGPLLDWECFCGQTGSSIVGSHRSISEPLDPIVDERQDPVSPAVLRH